MQIIFIILLFAGLTAFSQKTDTIAYYNANWEKVDSITNAKYYRTIKHVNDTTFEVRDYYINNNPHSLKTYKSKLRKIKHGQFSYWYENGQLKETGKFINGYQAGKWKKYYENGALRSECVYSGQPEIFKVVDKMPEFPGGQDSLYKYLSNNIIYPPIAKDNNITGVVYVRFIVDINGAISNVFVVRGIGGGCDEEAKRVISEMPDWEPGLLNNKPVKVLFEIPLRFKL